MCRHGNVDEEGRSTREQTGSGQPTAEAKDMRMTIEDSMAQRLQQLTTPFGLLDPETQEALRKWKHGWEAYVGRWIDAECLFWSDAHTYRARPVPLVPDTIDWSHVAPEWKWMARDEGGKTYIYEQKPFRCPNNWNMNDGEYARIEGVLASYRRGTVAWQDSLVQRPEGV